MPLTSEPSELDKTHPPPFSDKNLDFCGTEECGQFSIFYRIIFVCRIEISIKSKFAKENKKARKQGYKGVLCCSTRML